MDVIGNNIANVNTVDIKGQNDISGGICQTVRGQHKEEKVVQTQQIGLGVDAGSINYIHTEGAFKEQTILQM